jgi:hypothetical protein
MDALVAGQVAVFHALKIFGHLRLLRLFAACEVLPMSAIVACPAVAALFLHLIPMTPIAPSLEKTKPLRLLARVGG